MERKKVIINITKGRMNKVCFISVYLGKIPAYIKPFLSSCMWNHKFDFYLVCDSEIPYDIPPNVHVISMQYEEFKILINKKTGIELGTIRPYKLCDFKPAYGDIFSEYINGYEFWGMIDLDLILGNLNQFLKDDLLDNYDKIYTLGHMSLIRNTPELNSVYKKDTKHSRNYKKILINPLNCVFDEYEGITEKFVDEGYRVYLGKDCADTQHQVGRFEVVDKFWFRLTQPRSSYIDYCTDKNYRHEIFTIDRGRIFKIYFENHELRKKEYIYFHKLIFEAEKEINEESRLIITTKGYITDEDFFSRLDESTLTYKDMDRYNKSHLFKKLMRYSYLYVRLNIRYFRKKYFPRVNEI